MKLIDAACYSLLFFLQLDEAYQRVNHVFDAIQGEEGSERIKRGNRGGTEVRGDGKRGGGASLTSQPQRLRACSAAFVSLVADYS